MKKHVPVLLNEVVQYLDPKPNENFIDCTVGDAGHSSIILERIKPNGKVLGIDIDADSLKRIEPQDRLILAQGNFRNLKKIAMENNFWPVNGVLFDLGLSSWQIEESGKGFGFNKDDPLDMRFQLEANTAAEIVDKWSEEALIKIFKQYGEEKYSRLIARRIIKERQKEAIKTTSRLRGVIERAVPFSESRRGRISRVLARIFQALRITVNDELENLKQGIEQALEILEPDGRLAIISFHSLEDRIVKNFFREKKNNNLLEILTKKPITASEGEINNNPRSRSAKLRAIKKLLN